MWVRAGGSADQKILLFDYSASRSAEVARGLLADFRGTLLTDGYQAYDVVASAQGLVHAGCLAHVRRYFKDVIKAQPEASRNANTAIDYIGRLYEVERELRERKVPATPAERLEARQQKSRPIMAEFRDWLDTIAPKLLPESKFGKAVHYALGQWSKLQVYLDDPAVPVDNNRAENAIRPFVVGRRA